jgi:hypothetical protein
VLLCSYKSHSVWEIWLSRDHLHFDKKAVNSKEITYHIWAKIRDYIFIAWKALCEKIIGEEIDQQEAQLLLALNFGDSEEIYVINDLYITIPYVPIE